MSILESSVQNLADALDALEAKLDEKHVESTGHSENVDAARRQARAARAHASDASREISRMIGDIQSLLDADKFSNSEGSDGAG